MTHAITLPRTPVSLRASSLSSPLQPFRFSSITSIRAPSKARNVTSFLRFQPPETMISSTSSFPDHGQRGVLGFFKYHEMGKDFILVDNRDSTVPKISPDEAMKLCDRNFGIGADGVILAMLGINGSDYRMQIINSDGSEPGMYGDGIRCFARFIADLENMNRKRSFKVETPAGIIVPEIQNDGTVRLDMGEPTMRPSDSFRNLPPTNDQYADKAKLDVDGLSWNLTCVRMGNPHCVTFGTESSMDLLVDDLNLAELGPKFKHHMIFPARTSIAFVKVISPNHLKVRVWEHDSGATLACGTGACAAVVAAFLEGRAGRICTVDLPGGPLEIEWREADNHVYVTGAAKRSVHGEVIICSLAGGELPF